MPFHIDYDMTLFTPGEAEAVTGVSTTLQRDWRRRGFIRSGEGHARFDIFGLAHLAFLKVMSDRGIGPKAVEEVAEISANGIARYALACAGAIEDQEVGGASFADAISVVRKKSPLARSIARHVVTAPYFVLWADGSELWTDDFGPELFCQQPEDKISGPVLILDSKSLGELLFSLASRPLALARKIET